MDLHKILDGRKILVVDDEKFSRSIVTRLLADIASAEVVPASNGAEALAALVGISHEFAIAMIDFNMPVMNGLECLKAIRTGLEGIRNDLPAMMLTGNADASLVGVSLALDVDAFVVKPVSKMALVSRLNHVFAGNHDIKPAKAYLSVDIAPVTAKLLSHKPVINPDTAPPTKAKAGGLPPGRRVQLEALQLPATLAQDICAPSGELLLSAGVKLTERLLARLRELAAAGITQDHAWII